MAIPDVAEYAAVEDGDGCRLGEGEDARAAAHRQAALDALSEDPHAAVVHALLSVAERVSELSAYVAHRR